MSHGTWHSLHLLDISTAIRCPWNLQRCSTANYVSAVPVADSHRQLSCRCLRPLYFPCLSRNVAYSWYWQLSLKLKQFSYPPRSFWSVQGSHLFLNLISFLNFEDVSLSYHCGVSHLFWLRARKFLVRILNFFSHLCQQIIFLVGGGLWVIWKKTCSSVPLQMRLTNH